ERWGAERDSTHLRVGPHPGIRDDARAVGRQECAVWRDHPARDEAGRRAQLLFDREVNVAANDWVLQSNHGNPLFVYHRALWWRDLFLRQAPADSGRNEPHTTRSDGTGPHEPSLARRETRSRLHTPGE